MLNASSLNRASFVFNRRGDNKDQRSVYLAESDRQEQRLPVVNEEPKNRVEEQETVKASTRGTTRLSVVSAEHRQAFRDEVTGTSVEASTGSCSLSDATSGAES